MAHGCSLGFVLGRGGFASNIPFRKAAADPEEEIFTCSAFPRDPQEQSTFKSECQALIHLLQVQATPQLTGIRVVPQTYSL